MSVHLDPFPTCERTVYYLGAVELIEESGQARRDVLGRVDAVDVVVSLCHRALCQLAQIHLRPSTTLVVVTQLQLGISGRYYLSWKLPMI